MTKTTDKTVYGKPRGGRCQSPRLRWASLNSSKDRNRKRDFTIRIFRKIALISE